MVGKLYVSQNVIKNSYVGTSVAFNVMLAHVNKLIKIHLAAKNAIKKDRIVIIFVLSFAIQNRSVKIFLAKPKYWSNVSVDIDKP